jgi:hypothetical protein
MWPDIAQVLGIAVTDEERMVGRRIRQVRGRDQHAIGRAKLHDLGAIAVSRRRRQEDHPIGRQERHEAEHTVDHDGADEEAGDG